MKYMKLIFSIMILTGIGLAVGLTIIFLGVMGTVNDRSNETTTNSEIGNYSGQPPGFVSMSYEYVPFDTMIEKSNIILVGQVTNIGETKWNQDNGEYWEETFKDEIGETTIPALPYYEVTISPAQIIVDALGINEDQLVVTVVGMSGENNLKTGDEIITFVRQGEMAWYDGNVTYNAKTYSFETDWKSVLFFTGAPDQSYLLKGPDGQYQFVENYEQLGPFSLDELINLIQEKRKTP